MQQRDDLLLKRRLQVNQQIAAADQVEAGKGRVADHAVRREDAHLAQILVKLIGTRLVEEEALQPRRRDPPDQVARIARRARDAHCGFVDVGGEDLHLGRRLQAVHVLAQKDRDRIGLLAGGTADYPDADLISRALAFEQLWYDRGFEHLKGRIIAEEIGDPDQEVPQKRRDLVRVLLQLLDILLEPHSLNHLHPTLYAALKGAVLVFAEIVPGSRLQQPIDRDSASSGCCLSKASQFRT